MCGFCVHINSHKAVRTGIQQPASWLDATEKVPEADNHKCSTPEASDTFSSRVQLSSGPPHTTSRTHARALMKTEAVAPSHHGAFNPSTHLIIGSRARGLCWIGLFILHGANLIYYVGVAWLYRHFDNSYLVYQLDLNDIGMTSAEYAKNFQDPRVRCCAPRVLHAARGRQFDPREEARVPARYANLVRRAGSQRVGGSSGQSFQTHFFTSLTHQNSVISYFSTQIDSQLYGGTDANGKPNSKLPLRTRRHLVCRQRLL